MTKSTDAAVEWLIDTVKEALEEGRATAADLEEWLLAAILLEEMALEEHRDAHELRSFGVLDSVARTLH